MYTIKLKVNKNVLDKILYFLKNFPEKDVKIIETINNDSFEKTIDFSKYKIKSFKKINNPVKWQNLIRDEWER